MYAKRLPWLSIESLDTVIQHLNVPPDDVRIHAPDIDTQIADVIMKGLALSPDDRWQTMTLMVTQFREAYLGRKQRPI